MDLITLDFETYYDSEYSLARKYNTSEYVRDSQFLIQGAGVKINDEPAYWISGHQEPLEHLRSLNLEKKAVIAHNCAFDGLILYEHAHIVAGQYIDTLSMARACLGHGVRHNLDTVARLFGFGGKTSGLEDTKGLRVLSDEKLQALGRYCINDVEKTAQIYQAMRRYIPDKEMKLIDLTMRMFCDPVLELDEELAQEALIEEQEEKKRILSGTDAETAILMSNDKFAEFLKRLDVEPPTKISPTTGKSTFAFAKTDKGFQKLLNHKDEAIAAAAAARIAVKSTIRETRAVRLLEAGKCGRPIPVLLNYSGAHTHRWSGGNKLNLQNLPRGGKLRKAILAPEGHYVLVYDLSQIEARITAWLSGQQDLVEAFREYDSGSGHDVYKRMASRIYSKRIEEVTKQDRFIGKICVLGLGYGMGAKRLAATLQMGLMGPPVDINEYQAKIIVDKYRNANPFIPQYWDVLGKLLGPMSTREDLDLVQGPVRFMYRMIELPSGLALKYPELTGHENEWGNLDFTYRNRYGTGYLWGGSLLENIVQALARCVISDQMLEVAEHYRIVSMTHDEIISVVPKEQIEDADKTVYDIMTRPPSWAPDLPLEAEGSYHERYSK